MRWDQTTLDNGLRIVGEYDPDALSLAVGFCCRTGSRDETPAESGVSHFLEHMMFKGTETLSYDDINKTFDAIGARYNAFTSEEMTFYFGQVLPEFQGRLTDLLGQMLRPALRGDDFDMEKNVILEEIAMYGDMPQWLAHDRCRAVHYSGHPLQNLVLGTNESITALERDQMADYFRRRYASDNLVVAVSGRYDWDALTARIGELCGGWEPAGAGRTIDAVDAGRGVELISADRFTQAHTMLMAPGFGQQDDRRWAAAVLAAAIGSGNASRLHWALVDPGLVESASLGHHAEDGHGVFAGDIACEPGRAQEALDIFRDVLAKAQSQGLSPDEVRRAQRRFASGLALQAESPLHRLVSIGTDVLYRGAITPLTEALSRIRAVTADECNAILAARPLDQLAVTCVGPLTSLH